MFTGYSIADRNFCSSCSFWIIQKHPALVWYVLIDLIHVDNNVLTLDTLTLGEFRQ